MTGQHPNRPSAPEVTAQTLCAQLSTGTERVNAPATAGVNDINLHLGASMLTSFADDCKLDRPIASRVIPAPIRPYPRGTARRSYSNCRRLRLSTLPIALVQPALTLMRLGRVTQVEPTLIELDRPRRRH